MLLGDSLIAGERVRNGAAGFRAFDPAAGEPLNPVFDEAGEAEVARAAEAAEAAFATFGQTDPDARARFLEAAADAIMDTGEGLIARAQAESGLPVSRLEGERARTAGQFRLFAAVLRDGHALGLAIEHGDPGRRPLPKPDMRLRNVGVGPVAVFGASNFPFAYSMAGGDTASALAAGCPVVVKGHPAHPGAEEMVAHALASAVGACGLPAGTVSLLQGAGSALGGALVAHPAIRAVGFTGSRAGGLALLRIAQGRPEPIPVFAEMSSINPVVLLPGALAARAEATAQAFVASLMLGAGQFCTNPGIVLALDGPDLDRFVAAAAATLGEAAAQTMLTPAIHQAFEGGVDALAGHPAVRTIARGRVGQRAHEAAGALFEADAAAFLADRALSREVFGSSSIVVRARSIDEIASVLAQLEGQLTASLHLEAQDWDAARRLLPLLERKAGRIVANGWPTGLEVGWATVHGGPFPATSDGRTTSVGARAIDRFLRPVCYQDIPDALLPAVLREGDAPPSPRRIDGRFG